MEGYPANPLVPPGYINSFTPFFFPQPQITHVLTTPSFVYVSPEGSDDPANVGSVTSPFQSITAALFYVTTVSATFPVPLSSPVCIFVAPGVYAGGFSVPDNVYLIGPSNSPVPVVITSSIFASPTSSSATIGIMNLTLQALEVAGAFFDVNLEVTNCKIQTETVFSALSIAPLSALINVNVRLAECEIRATDENNANLVSATASELVTLTLDRCELVSEAEQGNMIDMIGNLTIRNSSLTNIAAGTSLAPLILFTSGATLVPVLNLEGSILKYTDIQTDLSGNKLAVKFNADTQTITATMTNNTITLDGASVIIKNIGALPVTLFQCANSCLLAGNVTDPNNMIIFPGSFLDNVPSGGGGGAVYQATYYKTTAQNMTSGNTDVTFDGEATWNNDNGYITHTGGTTAFTVVQAGLYQLEFNATILINGATWTTTANKTINIDITRSPTAEQTIVSSTGLQGQQSYSQSICSTFYLDAGDVINLRLGNTFTSGPAQIQQLQNTFDFNTFFTWTYISASGGGGGVTSLAGLTGAVTFSSPGGTIGITPNGQDIELTNMGIVSLLSLTGAVTLVGGDGISVTTDPPPGANEISIANTGVLTIVAGANITTSGDTPQNPTINYVASPPAVQAATTTPLTGANVNVLYILTSGATQDFTTAGLGAGDAGKVWYVKNAFSSDIDIDANGSPVAGQTATIHAGTGSTNSSIQVLYWNGSALTMY